MGVGQMGGGGGFYYTYQMVSTIKSIKSIYRFGMYLEKDIYYQYLIARG